MKKHHQPCSYQHASRELPFNGPQLLTCYSDSDGSLGMYYLHFGHITY